MDQNFDHGWLSVTLALQGKESEAFESFMRFQSWEKVDEEIVQAYKTAFQTSGWQGVLRERVKRFEKVGGLYYDGASDNAQIGNKDKAFEYLEKSYQRRDYNMFLLKVEPRLDSLRSDPRFDDLVKRVGLN